MSVNLAAFDRAFSGPLAGVDEAGRGPLAGPVVAAAVVLPESGWPDGIDDSKKLCPAKREWLAARIGEVALVGVGVVEADEIDRVNIHHATLAAMARAVAALPCVPGHVLVDGKFLPRLAFRATAVIGGDAKSLAIAAASIIAKVTRDRIMIAAADLYPGYDWASNKGYAAPRHLAALAEHGPAPLHRRSFAPVARAYPAD